MMADKVPGGLPKVVLSDGRSIELNLYAVTRRDFTILNALSGDEHKTKSNDIYARITGLSADELEDLPFPDWVMLDRKIVTLLTNPLADPN